MTTIGIMGAMLEEIAHLKEEMSISQIHVKGGREYISGKLFGKNVVLVFSRWGKVASALTATTLISTFNVDRIIFTGVAGGAAPHLNIGDVVIGKELYQHDMDASPLFEKFEIPFLSLKTFKTHPDLLRSAEKGASSFFENRFPHILAPSLLKEFSILSPKVHLGIIASGDQFISDASAMQKLTPETLAVEMEGASVAQVCHEHQIPFAIIRTISDRADHKAPIDFQKFVSRIASLYSVGIVREMFQG